MDFKSQQDAIKEYIESNLPIVLQEMNLPDLDLYIDDFIDFDRYKKSKQLFYDFGMYNFDNLSNESETEEFTFSIYLTFRSSNPSTLKEQMLNYSTAFYKMFDDSGRNLGGIADIGIIETITMFPMAEGYPDIKVAELSIKLITEK